jgi:hypothetical protein
MAPPGNVVGRDLVRHEGRRGIGGLPDIEHDERRDQAGRLVAEHFEPRMHLAAQRRDQARQKRHRLRDQSDGEEIDEIDETGNHAVMRNLIGEQHHQTQRTAEPVVDRGAEQFAPHHLAGAERGQALGIPGAVADFADHAECGIAGAPQHHDAVIENFGRDRRRPVAARQRRRKKDQQQHDAHRRQTARRHFQPEIAVEFGVHGAPAPSRTFAK